MAKKKGRAWALESAGRFAKTRDLLDYDYLSELSPDERAWLEQFSREFYHAQLDRAPRRRYTDDERREMYRDNNARNRDVWVRFERDVNEPDPETTQVPDYVHRSKTKQ